MSDRVFLDTNILVYADDADAGAKHKTARKLVYDLIASSRAVLSTQVLQEYFVIATRKLGVKPELARRKVEALAELEVVRIRSDLIVGAIDLHRLHSLSFWDALIVRCASAAGCRRIFSEGMSPGQTLEGVEIENPFGA